MGTVITLMLFLFGFILLVKGADILIDGASVLAKKLGLSDLLVGLTIVAFGTSLPEMIVNLYANTGGVSELGVGNIIGSNIANILLILGVCALIAPLTVRRVTVWREVLLAVAASFVLLILISDKVLNTGGFEGLDIIDGIMLITLFVIFLYYTFGHRTHLATEQSDEQQPGNLSLGKATVLVLLGVVGVGLGGQWIVNGAQVLAEIAGLNQEIVGLTILAIGTSIPELATSVTAVRKRNIDIAVGGVLGSNIFNTFWVLGLNAVLTPIAFNAVAYTDVIFAVAAALMLFAALTLIGTRHSMSKLGGVTFLSVYVAYLAYLVLRQQHLVNFGQIGF